MPLASKKVLLTYQDLSKHTLKSPVSGHDAHRRTRGALQQMHESAHVDPITSSQPKAEEEVEACGEKKSKEYREAFDYQTFDLNRLLLPGRSSALLLLTFPVNTGNIFCAGSDEEA